MGWVAPAVMIAGTVLGASGQVKAGQNAKDVLEYNQQLAKYKSKYAQQKGELEVAALERDVNRYMSRKRSLAGKSGTVGDIGSNMDTLTASRREADIDASLIRYNADLESWAAKNDANLLGMQSSQVSQAGYINAGTTLLGGLSKWDWKRSSTTPYSSPPSRTR